MTVWVSPGRIIRPPSWAGLSGANKGRQVRTPCIRAGYLGGYLPPGRIIRPPDNPVLAETTKLERT